MKLYVPLIGNKVPFISITYCVDITFTLPLLWTCGGMDFPTKIENYPNRKKTK